MNFAFHSNVRSVNGRKRIITNIYMAVQLSYVLVTMTWESPLSKLNGRTSSYVCVNSSLMLSSLQGEKTPVSSFISYFSGIWILKKKELTVLMVWSQSTFNLTRTFSFKQVGQWPTFWVNSHEIFLKRLTYIPQNVSLWLRIF